MYRSANEPDGTALRTSNALKPRRPWWRFIAILTAVGLVAAACGGGSEDTDEGTATASGDEGGEEADSDSESESEEAAGSGGTLRIGMTAGNIPFPGTPPNEGFEGRRFVGYQIYDGLFRFNVEQGDDVPVPEPGLAESFEVSDDELTWTITLREDVTFHDGTTFDADAVIFNLDRVTDEEFEYYDADSANSNVSWFAQIESYEKTGDYEVTFTTSNPYAWLPYDLSFVYFASPEVVMAHPDDYLDYATGTGPFKMVEYVDGQTMVLEAFDDYYRGRPLLDSIELFPMPEPATRLAALQAGDIDWAELPPPDSVEQLEASGFEVYLKEYPHVITYQLNVQKPPFDDVRVRQALNYAVDAEGTSALINNVGYPADQYLYEGHPWYDESWEGYDYDPERAIELLAEAGVEEGLEFNIAYPTGGSGNMFPGPMNEKLQSDLKAVGIEANLIPMEWNTIITGLRQGLQHPDWEDIDGLYISLAPLYPSGLRLYVTDFAPETAGFGTASCCNAPGYSNPEVDRLYYEASAEFDPAASDALLAEMQSVMMQDAPVLVTVHDLNLRVLDPKVKGFTQPQSWFADLTSIYIEE